MAFSILVAERRGLWLTDRVEQKEAFDARMILNFAYVIPDKLAGCAHPGWRGGLAVELSALASEHQIGAIVSLCEEPLSAQDLKTAGLDSFHLPVRDFGVPTVAATDEAVEFVLAKINAGERVVAHCTAGCGRTGTFLACCLVALEGCEATQAILKVRETRPGSIETPAQEAFVRQWAASRAESRGKEPAPK